MKSAKRSAPCWLRLAVGTLSAIAVAAVVTEDSAGAQQTRQPSEAAQPRPGAEFKAGARIYADACSACHGRSGEGRIGPALAGNRNLDRSDYLLAIVLRGGDGMPAFHGRLSEAEIVEVSGFIASAWGNRFEGIDRQRLASQWWRGAGSVAALYQRVCARCHGTEGGGLIGPALAGNGNLGDPQYVAGKILHGQGGMPAFERLLPPEGIASLASYVRNAYGNEFGPVELETVLALRSLPGREEDRSGLGTTTNLEEYLHSCALCHGLRGQGGVGPALDGNARLESVEFVLERVLNGSGAMPAFGRRLTDRQIAAIVTHERVAWENGLERVSEAQVGQRREAEDPHGEAEANREAGATLYASQCAVCHGALGGGGVGPALRGNGELRFSGHAISRVVMGGGGMPPFADVLSSAELAAVTSYVRTAWGNRFGPVSTLQAQNYHPQGAAPAR